jgi:hypothetical protein
MNLDEDKDEQEFNKTKVIMDKKDYKMTRIDKYNYLLIGLVSKMFICESVNDKAQVYSNREVKYHPHESWILKNK